MKLTKFEAQTSAEPTLMQRVMRRMARLMLQPLALAIILQPAAFAAPNPSLLAQLPKYMDSTAASNTVFVMDDSMSMLMGTLPGPAGVTYTAGGPFVFNLDRANPLTGATTATVARFLWLEKAATINPLFYNVATEYKPWNNNGVRMPLSDIHTDVAASGFRNGYTLHDPRFMSSSDTRLVLPDNRGSGALNKDVNGKNLQRFVGWNAGVTPYDDSPGDPKWFGQDIFSRPLLRLECKQCSVSSTPAVAQCASNLSCSDNSVGAFSGVNTSSAAAFDASLTSGSLTPLKCTAATEVGFIDKGPTPKWTCPTGDTVSVTGSPYACVLDAFVNFNDGALPFCCPSTGTITACSTVQNCPAGRDPASCTAAGVNHLVTKPNELVIANYFRYEGNINPGGTGNPANYTLVEIERYKSENANGTGNELSDQKFLIRNLDGSTVPKGNVTIRPDCTASIGANKACTWAEEAQNFANWYTYYRTRLFSAIAVTAEALSELTADKLLDSLRLGYGSINYFDKSRNPFAIRNPWGFDPATASIRTVPDVDIPPDTTGFVSNVGTLNRGVREFRQGTPERQQVFNWLFSLRPQGATPNREALDSVGRYFSRKDKLGPWADTPGVINSQSVTDHASCRRSYAILVTDGEWTKTESLDASRPAQPLLEDASRPAVPAWVSSQAASTPLNASSNLTVPVMNDGVGLAKGEVFPPPTGQPQFSTVTGSPTGTLADVAYYWWSRDLRPDVDNGVRPLLTRLGDAPEKVNNSFWQNMTPFIVGYGLTASMDLNPATRTAINAEPPTSLTWPSVDTTNTKIQDQQCGTAIKDIYGNVSGCGRINDTFRAGRVARGDFFAATDIAALARKVAEVLATINEVDGSAAAYTGRSATLREGDFLYSSKFTTSSWTGSIEAYDAIRLNESLLNKTAAPTPSSISKIPSNNVRNIFTSTDVSASGTTFSFDNLSAAQKLEVGNANVVEWVRGNQSVEAQKGGTLRNRGIGEILGDIINSNPLYSGTTDARYTAYRHPAASKKADGTYATVDYPAFVRAKSPDLGLRPATIFAGANDGMLHAFTTPDLNEKFAYVPRAVYLDLPALATSGYLHRYYVDGPVVEGDVYINGKWRTVLVGTNGAGATGIFALDVTQLNDDRSGSKPFGAGDVIWDIAAKSDTAKTNIDALGHITHPGVIGSGLDGEWYYFTGNGWESSADKASLLAIRIRDGEIFKVATDGWGGTNPVDNDQANRPNGLGGITPIYDGNRNIVNIYAGDRAGRLWKFDLTSNNRNEWKAEKVLFNTAEHVQGGVTYRQPISAAPRIVPHPNGGRLIILGTGRLTESTDISDFSVQSIYGIWEQKPTQLAHPKASLSWPLSPTNLQEINLTETVVASGMPEPPTIRQRSLNAHGFSWGTTTKEGWRLDLKGTTALGERVIVSPIEQGGFVGVSTFEPVANGDKCQGGGASFFYRFDVAQTFTRFALKDGSVDIVGYELTGGSVGGMRLFGTGSNKPEAAISTISKDDLTAALKGFGRNGTAAAAVESVCASTAGGRTIANKSTGLGLTQCPGQSQRVWRDLPRGAQ